MDRKEFAHESNVSAADNLIALSGVAKCESKPVKVKVRIAFLLGIPISWFIFGLSPVGIGLMVTSLVGFVLALTGRLNYILLIAILIISTLAVAVGIPIFVKMTR